MPAPDRDAPRKSSAPAFLTAGLLFLGAATLDPGSVRALVDEYLDVQRALPELLFLAPAIGLALLALVLLLARTALGRLTPLFFLLGLAACAAGIHGRQLGRRVDPWQEEGLSMVQRLATIRDSGPPIYGLTVEELRANLRKVEGKGKPRAETSTRFFLGRALMRDGHLEEAVVELERAREIMGSGRGPEAAKMERDLQNTLIGAYLRLGEMENCMLDHNQDSCLLPIRGGGVHGAPRGSQAAIGHIERLLRGDPEDLMGRWLLNLAHMTLGTYPDGVPERFRIAPEAFASDAPFARFYDVAPALGLAVADVSGSSILEDFDRDGDLDLLVSSMRLGDQLRYFENAGDGTFAERTDAAGLGGQFGGLNVNHADFDNDGYADVLVLRGGWMGAATMPNSLLRNDGDGTFTDVTEVAGVLSYHGTQAAAWADFDLDGHLDLFIANENTKGTGDDDPCELYRNDGDGTFTDVIDGSGIQPRVFAKGCTWGDFDNDGRPDLYVSRRDGPNRLYRNEARDGGGWRFVDVTEEAGVLDDFRSFACWFFDHDNDGWEDLFVAGYGSEFRGEDEEPLSDIPAVRLGLPTKADGFPRLYRNRGDGTFENVAQEVGLERVIMVMGANFGDLDNDGWLDVYLGTGHPDFRALMANRMFKNDRGRRFLDVTTAGGFGHLQKGHGVSFGDVDNDGDQDVYAVMGGWYAGDSFPNVLFHNPGTPNDWVGLTLEGVESNRGAVGARLRIALRGADGGRTVHRTVTSGGSFGSSTYRCEIGLGRAATIESVTVRWPSGREQTFAGLEKNRHYGLREGGQPEDQGLRPISLQVGAGHEGHSH